MGIIKRLAYMLASAVFYPLWLILLVPFSVLGILAGCIEYILTGHEYMGESTISYSIWEFPNTIVVIWVDLAP